MFGSAASPVERYVNLENHFGARSNVRGRAALSDVNGQLEMKLATPDNPGL